jgi:hypothetical protein
MNTHAQRKRPGGVLARGLCRSLVAGMMTAGLLVLPATRGPHILSLQAPVAEAAPAAQVSCPRTLSIGDRGVDVRLLQDALNRFATDFGFQKIKSDGVFGPKTQDMVELYQATVGLTVDGVVGTQTWLGLGMC